MPRRYLVTAGPTHEPIDAVRYIANRSSGRMGLALTQAALAQGHRVQLLLGPIETPPPDNVVVERFTTAADLRALLDFHQPQCDVLIMAAAVADYTPRIPHAGKQPRGEEPWQIDLQPTDDLVTRCAARRSPGQIIVGFALEQEDRWLDRARAKLTRKSLDAIVANRLQTMGSSDIDAAVIDRSGAQTTPGAMPKTDFAAWLIEWIDDHLPEPST
jgi:phosphopantothenoylcysteine decarboxylase/phosphopantothenate--cysteine ligase